jgi:hypothetical protein
MLLNILDQLKVIVNTIDEIQLDESRLKILEVILKKYDKSILPIDLVKDKLRLNYEQTNTLLITLAKNNILQLNYKIWCDNSVTNSNQLIYTDFLDIPMEVCENCNKQCRVVNNIVVVYRVNLNGIK